MWLEEDISKVVSFFDCRSPQRKNRAGAKTDYVFNFLLHLPNFFPPDVAARKNMEPTRGVAIKIFARNAAAGAAYFEEKTRKR